jgi:hypothetical protein
MGDLQPVGAGNKFTAIPETGGRFTRENKDSAGDRADDPARDIVDLFEIHGAKITKDIVDGSDVNMLLEND